MPDEPQKRSGPTNPSRYLAVVVLALAGVVAALTLRIGRPGRPRQATGPTLAEQVLAKSRPLVEQGQYGPAIGLMEAYVAGHDADFEVRPLLAEALLAAGRYDRAELTVDELIARAPRMARAHWLKGRLVRRRGGQGMAFFQAAAECPDASADILAACGLEFLAAGNLRQAETCLLRARKAGLDDARTLGPLGELALRQGRLGRAEALLAEAVETDRRNARLWAMLAEAQSKAGRADLAAETLAEAVLACPRQFRLAVGAGRAQLALGNRQQAKRYADLAGQLAPSDPEALALQAEIRRAERAPQSQPRSLPTSGGSPEADR